jgi:hypothetical protein
LRAAMVLIFLEILLKKGPFCAAGIPPLRALTKILIEHLERRVP